VGLRSQWRSHDQAAQGGASIDAENQVSRARLDAAPTSSCHSSLVSTTTRRYRSKLPARPSSTALL